METFLYVWMTKTKVDFKNLFLIIIGKLYCDNGQIYFQIRFVNLYKDQ